MAISIDVQSGTNQVVELLSEKEKKIEIIDRKVEKIGKLKIQELAKPSGPIVIPPWFEHVITPHPHILHDPKNNPFPDIKGKMV